MQHLDNIAQLRNVIGTYVLVIKIDKPITVCIGRSGRLVHLEPAVYFYIGSAGGPGGLYARLKRHLQRPKRLFWHIDALTIREEAGIERIYVCMHVYGRQMESMLARCLERQGLRFVRGFGSTDDKESPSHLYYQLTGSDYSRLEACVSMMCKEHRGTPAIIELRS